MSGDAATRPTSKGTKITVHIGDNIPIDEILPISRYGRVAVETSDVSVLPVRSNNNHFTNLAAVHERIQCRLNGNIDPCRVVVRPGLVASAARVQQVNSRITFRWRGIVT